MENTGIPSNFTHILFPEFIILDDDHVYDFSSFVEIDPDAATTPNNNHNPYLWGQISPAGGHDEDILGTITVHTAIGGDLNGDGYEDLVIDLPPGIGGEHQDVGAYVLFGSDAGFGENIDLRDLTAAEGFAVINLQAGRELLELYTLGSDSTGDTNGDGISELIVTLSATDGTKPQDPVAYVLFGNSDSGGFGDNLDLANLTADQGIAVFAHELGHQLGSTLDVTSRELGDINGDGFNDLEFAADNGETRVLLGGIFDGGTPVQTIGTAAAEILIGGGSKDTLTGGYGSDVFRAGGGDDLMLVADAGFARVDGGLGFDTLVLDGSNIGLDLGNADITGVEAIDLGSGGNTVSLDLSDLLDLSGETDDLFVFGNIGGGVMLGADFIVAEQTTMNGITFNVFTAAGSDARLLAETDLAVTQAVA